MTKNITGFDTEIYTDKDSYNKRGLLLLRKGQRITNEIKIRLERIGYISQDSQDNTDYKNVMELSPITQGFIERKNLRNKHILEKPNQVLNTILFENKDKEWWIYINALSNYVDWLYTHSIDVAMISLMMAVELGYNRKELFYLGLGAMLHDMGKLLVPRSIIEKPNNLSDMERTYIRQHCELGAGSLESFSLPKECTNIIMQHHERIDGSGYPNGLKGDEICRNARIVMIADAVDAITSFRSYGKPQNMDTAIKKLRKNQVKYPQELIWLLERIM